MTYMGVKDLKPNGFKRLRGVKPHTFATLMKAVAATGTAEREERPRSGLVARGPTPLALSPIAHCPYASISASRNLRLFYSRSL